MDIIGRHGDLLIVRCEESKPTTATASDKLVLALGETTGHAHVITAPHIESWVGTGGQTRFTLAAEGILTHEEHGAQTLAPGTYRVIPQRETDLAGEWQRVTD